MSGEIANGYIQETVVLNETFFSGYGRKVENGWEWTAMLSDARIHETVTGSGTADCIGCCKKELAAFGLEAIKRLEEEAKKKKEDAGKLN